MKSPLLVCFAVAVGSSLALAVNDQDARGDHPDAPPRSPEAERASFHLPPGFEIQLVAAEPEIQKPINLTFDGAGRLWVTGSEMYPWPAGTDAAGVPIPDFAKAFGEISSAFHAGKAAPEPRTAATDTVRVLSAFGPDGRASQIHVFAEGLNIPSGVQPLPRKPESKGDAVIVYSIPGIWRLEDNVGDGQAHVREPLLKTFGFLDTHGGSSSYLYWIDGWIYATHGFRNHSEVTDRLGLTTVLDSGNTYRFRPDGSHFEIYTHGQTNPFGLAVDPLGNFYSADSHSRPVYMLLRGGWYEGIGKQHDGLGFAPKVTTDGHGSTAIGGLAYYAATQFPEEYRGNTFNGNVVTQRLNRDRYEWHGSTPQAVRMPDFLTSDDPWFRPVNVKLGPDGALYIADFYNPIIGHYEFPLTDPRRDHTHGRIWRVVWRGEHGEAAPTSLPDLSKADAHELLAHFADPNVNVRILAVNELVDRIGSSAIPDLIAYLAVAPDQTVDPAAALAGGDLPALGASHALWALARLDFDGSKTNSASNEEKSLEALLESQTGRVLESVSNILAHRGTLPLKTSIVRDNPAAPGAVETQIDAETIADHRSPLDRRAIADLLGAHPEISNLGLLLSIWSDAAADDTELIYTARAALRDTLALPDAYAEADKLAAGHADIAGKFAEVSLAVKKPEAGEFLIHALDQLTYADPRAAEYLRHALLYLPANKVASVADSLDHAAEAPPAQRLALADSLSQAARQRGIALPEKTTAWIQAAFIGGLSNPDENLQKRAIEAVREAQLPAKLEPLVRIVADQKRPGPIRISALEAMANLPQAKPILFAVMKDPSSLSLRKRCAEVLGQSSDEDSRQALAFALATAPGELGTVIAASLAKTPEGATTLLQAVENGKAAASLLRATLVAAALEKQGQDLRDRAAKLTANIPAEDTRLDGVVAARVESLRNAQPNVAHGAEIFRQTCTVCHALKNQGANIGPALDGISARGPHRVAEDILDPNRNVDPMFRQTIVETADGLTLSGLNPRIEGELLILTDVTGKNTSIPKSSIKKQTQSTLSLMPVGFETAIPANDFTDLLGFLMTQ